MRKKHIIPCVGVNLGIRKDVNAVQVRWWKDGSYHAKSFGSISNVESWLTGLAFYRTLRMIKENRLYTDLIRQYTDANINLVNEDIDPHYQSLANT